MVGAGVFTAGVGVGNRVGVGIGEGVGKGRNDGVGIWMSSRGFFVSSGAGAGSSEDGERAEPGVFASAAFTSGRAWDGACGLASASSCT